MHTQRETEVQQYNAIRRTDEELDEEEFES